ncbi:MAG: hypothetical protein OHK0046_20280 [Anaerolineae bacterium]
MINTPAVVHVPLRTDQHGVIRIGETRVTLTTVIGRYNAGDSPEEIHDGFPTVPLTDVYAIIAYYLGHRVEVDAYIRQEQAAGQRLRQEHESPGSTAYYERLRTTLNDRADENEV